MEQAEYVDISLRQLKLRSGVSLQTQGMTPGSKKEEAHYLAAINGKGLMISHGGRTTLTAGAEYRITGFNGQYDFYFTATVLQTFEVPVAYAVFAPPGNVKAKKVRQAERMKVSLPAAVRTPGNGAPIQATILDLSLYGAMFCALTPAGAIGDAITIALEFPVEGEQSRLSLASNICHSRCVEVGEYHVGVFFKDVSSGDKLLLHYLTSSAME